MSGVVQLLGLGLGLREESRGRARQASGWPEGLSASPPPFPASPGAPETGPPARCLLRPCLPSPSPTLSLRSPTSPTCLSPPPAPWPISQLRPKPVTLPALGLPSPAAPQGAPCPQACRKFLPVQSPVPPDDRSCHLTPLIRAFLPPGLWEAAAPGGCDSLGEAAGRGELQRDKLWEVTVTEAQPTADHCH